jgi:hypothetical protein
VDFDFLGSAITSLPPGARALIVKNAAAFTSRYGAGRPVAGEWDMFDVLSNAGENLKLSYGAGAGIHEFTYDDVAPWPVGADVGGFSLVLINPATRPNHAVASNWRASVRYGGTPGDSGVIFSEWALLRGVVSDTTDNDFDGIINLLEYALGGDPLANSQTPLPESALQNISVSGVPADFLTFTFRRKPGAEDLTYSVQFNTDVANAPGWAASGALVTAVPQSDGSVLETWRAATPLTIGIRHFARLKVTRQ